MRRLISSIHSSFNGVVTGPDPQADFTVWTKAAAIKEGSEILLEVFETVDTLLLGRHTYEQFAKTWPEVNHWPDVQDIALRLGEKINTTPKLVATSADSGGDLAWGEFEPAQPLTGHVEDKVADLKKREGGDILMFGSPTLVRSLTDADLIDEYQIFLHPVVVTEGEHLFDSLKGRKDFRLRSTRTFGEGAVLVTYSNPALDARRVRTGHYRGQNHDARRGRTPDVV